MTQHNGQQYPPPSDTEASSPLKDIPAHIKEYVQIQLEYVKAVAAGKVAGIVSNVMWAISIMLFGLFMVVFLSVAAGIAIGRALGDMALGFLIVAGCYLLLAGLMVAFRKPLVRARANAVIKAFYVVEEEEIDPSTEPNTNTGDATKSDRHRKPESGKAKAESAEKEARATAAR